MNAFQHSEKAKMLQEMEESSHLNIIAGLKRTNSRYRRVRTYNIRIDDNNCTDEVGLMHS